MTQLTEDNELNILTAKQLGEPCLIAFARLLKTISMYDRRNDVFVQVADESLSTIGDAIAALGSLSLKIVQDTCSLNNLRIHVSATNFLLAKYFIQAMRSRWIGEVEFARAPTKQELITFIDLLAQLETENDGNFLSMIRGLQQAGISGIRVSKLDQFRDEMSLRDSESKRRLSKDIYFKTLDVIKDTMVNANTKRGLQARKVKRQIMRAVDLIVSDESSLLSLANIKNYDDYTFNHSVNVAIYAIALGQRLGIEKRSLTYLGMAGLFHDIGKTAIDVGILNKPGTLAEDEWLEIRNHPMLGAEILLGFNEWSELSARLFLVAFEHHIKYDNSGYPLRHWPAKNSLFSRIVTLADCYDAMSRPRVYRPFPYISEKILGYFLSRSGRDFDPILVKLFINMIGLFPLGSLVKLSTGELGIVVQAQLDQQLVDRPSVCLLQIVDEAYQRGETVDLTQRDANTGEFLRSIVSTLDPREYGVQIAELLI